MSVVTLKNSADSQLSDLIAIRRDIHRHPETGYRLPRTRDAIIRALDGLGLEVTTGGALDSVTAVLRGAGEGPAVLLRGDMDALPLQELADVDYASTNRAMHACGHDLHVAGLIGAARVLAEHRDELSGSVVFMFQPAEESGGGARLMIEEGVLRAAGTEVVAAYAVHVMAGELGVFSTRPGVVASGGNTLRLTVTGRGGHGSKPEAAIDPVPVAAEIILALQSYATRRISVFDPVVITMTYVRAGEVLNAIPEFAEIGGSIRTLSRESLAQLQRDLPELVTSIGRAHGCEVEVDFRVGYPVTVNDVDATEAALATLTEQFGEARVQRMTNPVMGSEDFSYVLQEVPGTFVFLGTTPPGSDPSAIEGNHSPRAIFDDSVLADQARALAALAASHLGAR